MEDFQIYKIDSLGVKLDRKGDLIYHEGPLLSHFVDVENEKDNYFYKWADCDEVCNRWLIFKISHENLILFFQSQISLLDLIQRTSFVFFMDLDNELNPIGTYIYPTQKIPYNYLPSKKSFFKENQYEEYAQLLKSKINSTLSVSEEKQEITHSISINE